MASDKIWNTVLLLGYLYGALSASSRMYYRCNLYVTLYEELATMNIRQNLSLFSKHHITNMFELGHLVCFL